MITFKNVSISMWQEFCNYLNERNLFLESTINNYEKDNDQYITCTISNKKTEFIVSVVFSEYVHCSD
jgi:hypothetical protein